MPDLIIFPKFSYPALDTVEKLADQLIEWNFDGVDIMIRGNAWCKENDYFETLPAFVSHMQSKKLKAYTVTTDWKHDKVAGIEDSYKLFADNGVTMYRFLMQTYRGAGTFHDDWKKCRESLEKLEPLGRKYGVKALLQTHGDSMTWSPEAAYFMVQGLDPKAIGVHYDPGNMWHQEGWTEPVKSIDVLGEYLSYVVTKNLGWFYHPDRQKDQKWVWDRQWTYMPDGMIDWPVIFAELKKAGFEGPICTHHFYEATQEGLDIGTRIDVKFIREQMKKVCQACHSPGWTNGHFDRVDKAVENYNEVYYKPMKKLIDELYEKKLLNKDKALDEKLEIDMYELWHHEGRRARFGAAMMAPDYA